MANMLRKTHAVHTVGCTNPQCRVVEYKPQATHDRCPACYGAPPREKL